MATQRKQTYLTNTALHNLKSHQRTMFFTFFINRFSLLLALLTALSLAMSANAEIEEDTTFQQALAKAALERTKHAIVYDGRYFNIDYPGGDVPAHLGVCTDVVIRSYRSLGIDLQELVHNDMKGHFAHYPAKRIWGQANPDTNIDHRRVPNLATFFSRHGDSLPVTHNKQDYQPGDIVTWQLENNLPHIGIVADVVGASGNPMIIHNIGAGPKLEDALFSYTITGHFRYINRHQNDTMRHNYQRSS